MPIVTTTSIDLESLKSIAALRLPKYTYVDINGELCACAAYEATHRIKIGSVTYSLRALSWLLACGELPHGHIRSKSTNSKSIDSRYLYTRQTVYTSPVAA